LISPRRLKKTSSESCSTPAKSGAIYRVSGSGKVAFILNESGTVELRPVRYTLSALRGIIPALPQADADDIDTQISEALAEGTSKRQRF
jgi:hypothetical protein